MEVFAPPKNENKYLDKHFINCLTASYCTIAFGEIFMNLFFYEVLNNSLFTFYKKENS